MDFSQLRKQNKVFYKMENWEPDYHLIKCSKLVFYPLTSSCFGAFFRILYVIMYGIFISFHTPLSISTNSKANLVSVIV